MTSGRGMHLLKGRMHVSFVVLLVFETFSFIPAVDCDWKKDAIR